MNIHRRFLCLIIVVFILTNQIVNGSDVRQIILKKQRSQTVLTKTNDIYDFDNDQFIENYFTDVIKSEEDMLKCPNGCVCQYAHFMDLSISRWINYMQSRKPENIGTHFDKEDSLEIENDSEALHDGDENFLTNPYTKQATCILQNDVDTVELIEALPHDLKVLILLYTGIGHNKTVNTSILKTLNQLTTIEIRGTQDKSLQLIFDEPLSFIQHANFESITLLGSDAFYRPKNPVHPSDSFDYKPKGEFYSTYGANDGNNLNNTAYLHNGNKKLGFEPPVNEIEILPYNVYKQELKKARMPNFYGWNHLEVLRIHNCDLDELYWEMFDGLESLQHMSLERNKIVDITPFALYGALHIKTLSLAHNEIKDMHYRSLAGLLELEMLDLSDNNLSKLSEMSFPPFPKLERVNFRHNPIKYIFPATFWVMNETREMFFESSSTALELLPNEPFESLRHLNELVIENISVYNLEQNIFKGLTSLKKLKIRGNVGFIDFDAFSGLERLEELNASHCGIQEISMDAFIDVKKLKILDLSHNNIAYIPQGLLDDQTELVEIYLQGNQLRTLPSNFFTKSKLMLARLNDNPWKCSCSMINWRAKIINQQRGSRVERCISDFQTGEKISCRTVENYIFDNKLAPRCENYNGRSVFYVMRKQLQCKPKRIIHRQTKHRNHKFPKSDHKNNNINSNNIGWNKSPRLPAKRQPSWQNHREQKTRNISSRVNSLEYALKSKYPYASEQHVKSNQVEEISNEV